MKRIFMLTLAVMCAGLVIFSLSACSKNGEAGKQAEEVTIVGKWDSKDMDNVYYTFNEDGTGGYYFLGGEMKFTYTDDGEAVTIQYENSSAPNVFKYEIEGTTLKIEDSFGEMVTYIKK